MFKEDLLEARERAEYRLVQRLYYADGPINKSELRVELGLSLTTFNRYIADVDLILQPLITTDQVQLMITKDSVTLALNGQVTIGEQVFYPFLQHSTLFRILMTLFNHHFKMAPRDFYRELNLSEPSFYRKIARVNELLVPFKLIIKGGRLVGQEFQIRYFYMSLMRILPIDYFAISPVARQISNDLKRGLAIKIPLNILVRVNHWWLVQQAAQRPRDEMNIRIPRAIQELLSTSALLMVVTKILTPVLMANDPENRALTINDFCLFILCHADLLFNTQQLAQLIDYPLADDTILGRQQYVIAHSLAQHPNLPAFPASLLPERKVFDIWLQPQLFSGVLYLYNDLTNNYLQHHLFTEHARLLTGTAIRTIQQLVSSPGALTSQELIRRRLLQYYMEADQLAVSPLQIGIDLLYTERINDFFYRIISRRLANIPNVIFSNYSTGQHYQLVVSNYPRKKYQNSSKVFRVSEIGTIADVDQIVAWVNQVQAAELRGELSARQQILND